MGSIRLETDTRFVFGKSRTQGCDRKKALEPVAKKSVVTHLQTEHHLSERHACRLVNLARSVFRYAAHPRDDGEIQTALAELAARHPEFGFRKMFAGAQATRASLEPQASVSRLLPIEAESETPS